MCSTPFGFTEGGIAQHQAELDPTHVLNAFSASQKVARPIRILYFFIFARGEVKTPALDFPADSWSAKMAVVRSR
jgi:hypothetical protein